MLPLSLSLLLLPLSMSKNKLLPARHKNWLFPSKLITGWIPVWHGMSRVKRGKAEGSALRWGWNVTSSISVEGGPQLSDFLRRALRASSRDRCDWRMPSGPPRSCCAGTIQSSLTVQIITHPRLRSPLLDPSLAVPSFQAVTPASPFLPA